ncbi:MAG: ABC transporter substrate-binding protein [Caldilinea sp.]|nr:ABC transporter substrate-binding protein [Caldilinea sp.]MDW8441766.1 ABC transporter substrate-binding protein [Caldilineaceae bacterium]
MRRWRLVSALLILIFLLGACAAPQGGEGAAAPAPAAPPADAGPSQLPVNVPRNEVFVADQIFRYSVIDNYNFWVPGPHTPHRHALMMETFWYRDQETGERLYGAAISDPIYNEDYTQMDVNLRDNIYWSDGVQFTADDVVYTVELLKSNPQLSAFGWSAGFNQFLDSIEKTGDFSVRFNLKESNPRFHTFFETRWNGMYIMPKHIFEKVEDPVTYTYSDPVVLGTYRVVQSDPNGFWELFERREDWQRTPAGIVVGKPGPKYVLTIFYGDSAKKAIAMSRGELDVFFDVDFEAFQTVLKTTPTARSWYKDFPWAYPNEIDVRHLAFNLESDPIYANKDVRWALALALDIVDLQTEYIGGVAKVTVMPVPPTAPLRAMYLDPLEEWLQNLEIEIEPGVMYKPYDPTVPERIAAWAEEQGYTVPGSPREVFGTGWWKYDPDAAERLLIKNGFSRGANGKWLKPDGTPWVLEIASPPDENDAFRMANAAADMWSDFGIDVKLLGLERSVWEQNNAVGQFQVSTPWFSFVLADGDSWPQVRGWHPRFYVPNGEDSRSTGGSNITRINDPKVGEFIDAMVSAPPGSPENTEITTEFLKYWTEQMYFITPISFKKFVTWDERYWTGFPTSENPKYMPLYWFQGGKFTFQSLEPVSR